MHDGEPGITAELAGELIARELPRLAGLPVTPTPSLGRAAAQHSG